MKFALFGLIAMLGVASCDTSSQSITVDAAAEAEEIVELESQWSEMFGAKDLDGIMELLAQDSVLIMPGSAPVIGTDNIRRVVQSMLESDVAVSWRSDHAVVAPSGDMAYDFGTATTTLADGSVVEGHYLVVWVKEDGRWKVAADMFN